MNDSHNPGSSDVEQPLVEMMLNVGDSVRIGDRILRLMDIDGDASMLRVDLVADTDDSFEDSGWSELPR